MSDPVYLPDNFAMAVTQVVEKERVRHPTDPKYCIHGLPLTVVADRSEVPDFIAKGSPPKYRVHCSSCVYQAVKRVLKGE